MELSIVVTSYKNPQLLKVCLNSLLENTRNIDCEIIVSDSETGEDTEMMMREDFPQVKFFPFKTNVGFQALLRKGIESSSGDYLLLLNGDIIAAENSISNLFEYIKNRPGVGMAGPKLLNFDGTIQNSCFRFYTPMTIVYRRTFLGKLSFAKRHLDRFLMKDVGRDSELEADWIMGSAMMVSRKALEKVGLMDPRYFMYMEDVDWCRRFWEDGFKVIYYPQSIMHHYHGKGSAKGGMLRSLILNKYTWIHISSALKYFWKFFGKENPHK